MSLTPNFDPPNPPPSWVGDLRETLAGLTVPEATPPAVDHAESRALAQAAHWLLTQGRDGAKRVVELVNTSSAPNTFARMVIGSGVDAPTITLTVVSGPAAAQETLFTYTLTFTAPEGSLAPRVMTRTAAGAVASETWLPWTTSGGDLGVLGAGDLAGDFARLFADAMSS